MIRRETRLRISFIIGFVAFLFAGIDSLEQNFIILSISNFLLAFVNIISLYFLKDKELTLKILLLFLNSCLAFIVSYSYYSVGKVALPLAWVVVGISYLVISLRTYNKNKQNSLSRI